MAAESLVHPSVLLAGNITVYLERKRCDVRHFREQIQVRTEMDYVTILTNFRTI
jgi:hypothetical protein